MGSSLTRESGGGAHRTHVAASPPAPTQQPGSVSTYIAQMTEELAGLARRAELDVLAYLLDIAQLEAETTARRFAREACAG